MTRATETQCRKRPGEFCAVHNPRPSSSPGHISSPREFRDRVSERQAHPAPTGSVTAPGKPGRASGIMVLVQKNQLETLERTPLKDMDASLLRQGLLLKHPDAEGLDDAMTLAAYLHRNQTRKSRGAFQTTHYVEHPYRVAYRMSRWGSQDSDLLIAGIVHDCPEDGADELATLTGRPLPEGLRDRQNQAVSVLGEMFNPRVARIAKAVSNDPEPPPGLSRLQKQELYRKKVIPVIQQDDEAGFVKVGDFSDNAGSLHHHVEQYPDMVGSAARKYRPLVNPFREASPRWLARGFIDAKGYEDINRMLDITDGRLAKFEKLGG